MPCPCMMPSVIAVRGRVAAAAVAWTRARTAAGRAGGRLPVLLLRLRCAALRFKLAWRRRRSTSDLCSGAVRYEAASYEAVGYEAVGLENLRDHWPASPQLGLVPPSLQPETEPARLPLFVQMTSVWHPSFAEQSTQGIHAAPSCSYQHRTSRPFHPAKSWPHTTPHEIIVKVCATATNPEASASSMKEGGPCACEGQPSKR